MNAEEAKRLEEDRREILQRPLSDEEWETRSKCTSNFFWKASLPIAILTQFFTFKNTGNIDRPPSSIYWRRGLGFLANIFVTSMIFARVCDYKLLFRRAELKNRERAKEGVVPSQGSEAVHHVQPLSRPDDFSYPSDAITDLSEPEGSYSTDFTSTKLDLEEETNLNIPRTTTYEDLRAKNRSSRQSPGSKSASTLNFDSETSPRKHSSLPGEPISTDQSSRARGPRKLNKYGDEIE